jgi:hypothetical protein
MTVKKGTCPSTSSSSRAGSVTYNDETGFLLSERELGLNSYSPISVSSSTTTKAECTYGYNKLYSYYNSNDRRIKYTMDASGKIGSFIAFYWERSRYYSSSG